MNTLIPEEKEKENDTEKIRMENRAAKGKRPATAGDKPAQD